MARRKYPMGEWIAAGAVCALGVAAVGFEIVTLANQPVSAATVHRPTLIEVAAAPATPAVTPAPAVTPMPAVTPTSAPTPVPAGLVLRRVLPIEGPMQIGDYYWNDDGVPAGPVVITIDLKAQVLSIFRDGYEIGTAAILYGADEKPTPLGVFPILQKDAKHVSTIYTGAPMPYMLRLTNDGVSIHGSRVGPNLATHGCIGVPVAFAKKLFTATKLGDKVIVTRGKMLGMGQSIT